MSERVKVFPMRDIGLNAENVDDLMLFRDDNGVVKAIAVNEVSVPRVLTATSYRVIFEDEGRFYAGTQGALEPFAEQSGEMLFVAAVSRVSGLVVMIMDASLARRYSFILMDANWPNIITIYTLDDNVIAVEDMPHMSLQPLVVATYDKYERRVWERAVQSASNLHVVIWMDVRTCTILEVYVPMYDYQIPNTQRLGRHQRVAFVQRKPLLLTRDNKLRLCTDREHHAPPSSPPPPHEWVEVKSADEVPFGDWNVPIKRYYYCRTEAGEFRVWLWRERMCTAMKMKGMLCPLVMNSSDQRLLFAGWKRHYPLPGEGRALITWFYLDLLRPHREGIVAYELLDAANVGIAGARNAAEIATATRRRLASLVDEDSLVVTTLTERGE